MSEDKLEARGRRLVQHIVTEAAPIRVYALESSDEVVIDFDEPVAWVALDEDSAMALAKELRRRAKSLRKRGRK